MSDKRNPNDNSNPIDAAFEEDPFFTGEFDIIELSPAMIPPPHEAATRPADLVPPGPPPRFAPHPEPDLEHDPPDRATRELPEATDFARHSDIRARVRTEAQRSLARWRERSRSSDELQAYVPAPTVPAAPAWPDEPTPQIVHASPPAERTGLHELHFDALELPPSDAPPPPTAHVASLGEVDLVELDHALAELDEIEHLDADALLEDPYEASGLFVVDQRQVTNHDALPGLTGTLQARLPGLEEDLHLPAPWGQYIFELRGEILAQKNPRLRAAWLHEAADVLRLTGDRWRTVAFDLDLRAAELAPLYLPALRSRLIECLRAGDREAYEEALEDAFLQAERLGFREDPDAQSVLSSLRFEIGVLREAQGEPDTARALYEEAALLNVQDPFLPLNLARHQLQQRDLEGYERSLNALIAASGDDPAANPLRALLLADTAEALRRAGRDDRAAALYADALALDPTLLNAYRGIQLLGWTRDEPALEIDGLRGQLALLLERGAQLARGDARRKLLKRKVAARFYRLAYLYARAGRHDEASAALQDALGVRRHDLLLLRAQERLARRRGEWSAVSSVINRQNALVTDTALRALLFVEQARAALRAGDLDDARACLRQSLELAPDCAPARFELQRLMLRSEDPATLLLLYAETARDRDPDPDAPWAAERAMACFLRGAVHELLLRDVEPAIHAYRQACAWSHAGPWSRALERVLLIARHYPEAADLYAQRVEAPGLEPAARRALHLKTARLAASHAQFELAISHYLRLLESTDPELDHLEELAHLYRLYGWGQEAAQILEQVVSLGGELARDVGEHTREGRAALEAATRSLKWLTRLYTQTNQHDAALRAYDLLLQLRPGDAAAVELRKNLLTARGEWGAVVDLLLQQAQGAEAEATRRDLAMEAAELCVSRVRDWRRARAILADLCAAFPDYNAAQDALEDLLRARGEWADLADHLLDRAARVAAQERAEAVRLALEAATLRRERLGDGEGALEALHLALALQPGFAPALWGIAELLHRSQRFQDLAEHYEAWMTLRVPPTVITALTQALAWIKEVHQDQLHEAVALHRALLDRAPDNVHSRACLVRLFQRLHLPNDEADMLEALAERVFDREDKLAFLKRAAQLRERLDQDATSLWQQALELDLSDREAEWGLERALQREQAHARLLTFYLQQARSGDSARRVVALIKIANVYLRIERLEDALEILRKVLALDPTQIVARLMLAQTARALQDWSLAAQLERELAQDAPDDSQRLLHLQEAARILRDHLHKPQEAAELLREIVHLDPAHDDAFDALAHLYRGAEDLQTQRRLLELLERRLDRLPPGDAQLQLLREATRLAGRADPARAHDLLQRLLLLAPDAIDTLDLVIDQAALVGAMDELETALHRRLLLRDEHDDDPARRAHLLDLHADLLLTHLGRAEDAALALQDLLRLQPEHPTARERLARARLHLGDYALACDLYKDLFELNPRPELALTIAELLEVHLRRRQEALAFYLRAQDLEPLSGPALDGFIRLADPLAGRGTAAPMNARLLNDRLDWLLDAHREAITADPWHLGLYPHLARIHALRGDLDALRAIAAALVYLGLGDQIADLNIPPPRPDAAARLLQGQAGRLSPDDLRLHLLPHGAGGLRRSLLAVLWEPAAQIDPDDLRTRGLSRADRIDERAQDPRALKVTALARALGVFGVDLVHHPSDPYAVLPLFTPEPVLVIGQGILERADDPFHLFRVARALEALRDGAGLMERRDAPAILAAFDDLLISLFGPLPNLPAFRLLHAPAPWLNDASRRLARNIDRRTRRDLQTLVEAADPSLDLPAEDFIAATRLAPLRAGLAVCGHFGVAADAIAGTTFSLDRESGPARTEAVLGALKKSAVAPLIEHLLTFLASRDLTALRARLGLAADGAPHSGSAP